MSSHSRRKASSAGLRSPGVAAASSRAAVNAADSPRSRALWLVACLLVALAARTRNVADVRAAVQGEDALALLRGIIAPMTKAPRYAGFVIVDRRGRILAALDDSALGDVGTLERARILPALLGSGS